MPEPFFVKGVLKAYVRAIGADEAYFLALYQSEQAPAEPAPNEPPPPAPPRSATGRVAASPPSRVHRPELMDFREAPGRSGPSPKMRKSASSPGSCPPSPPSRRRGDDGGRFLRAVAPQAGAPISRRSSLPPRPSSEPEAPREPPVKPGSTAAPAQSSFDAGLKLGLRFVADTWIQVAADGRIVLDGIQAAGRETASDRLRGCEYDVAGKRIP